MTTEKILEWLEEKHYQSRANNPLYNPFYNDEARDAIRRTLLSEKRLREKVGEWKREAPEIIEALKPRVHIALLDEINDYDPDKED